MRVEGWPSRSATTPTPSGRRPLYVSGIVPVDAEGASSAATTSWPRRAGLRDLARAGGRGRSPRRRQGHGLPARHRRPPAHQPGAAGVLRLRAPASTLVEVSGSRSRGALEVEAVRTCAGDRRRDRGAVAGRAERRGGRRGALERSRPARLSASSRSAPSRRWRGPRGWRRWPACRCSSRTSSTPAGVRTTYASSIYADHVPERTAPAVAALEAEGAIVVGKANADEFAWGVCGQNTLYGDPSTRRRPTASPAARAAATRRRWPPAWCRWRSAPTPAAPCGMPAGACGVVGLKTALGAVSVEGVFPLGAELRHGRPMARTVADCALAHAVLTGTPVPAPADCAACASGVLTACPTSRRPAAPGPARRPRAGRHVERLRALGADVREAVAARARGRHVGGVLRRGGRGRTRRRFPSRRDEYGPTIRAKLDGALHGDDRGGASGPRGAARRGGRTRRARARRRPRRSAHARRRRAAAGRRRRARRAAGLLRLHARRSATSAGPRSRSATSSSPAATPRRSSRPRSRWSIRETGKANFPPLGVVRV